MTTSQTSVWCAVDASALAAIAASRWRAWPEGVALHASPERAGVVDAARALAAAQGIGHVLRLSLRAERFARLAVAPIAAGELADELVGVIHRDADYRAAVTADTLEKAELLLGMSLPVAWKAYLQRETWFRRGWLASGDYVSLFEPTESAETRAIWNDLELDDRAGMIAIGGDGAAELITVDGRGPSSRVTLTGNASGGWASSVVLCESVEAFLDALDRGTFAYRFD